MSCPELTALDHWRDDPGLVRHVGECSGCAAAIEMLEQRAESMATAECDRFEPLLAAALDRTLPAEDRRDLDRHLALCLDCAAMMGTLGAEDAAAAMVAGMPVVDRDAYALRGEIKRGGMGRVLAADDLRIGRPVAIKELLGRTPTLAARFEREARMTARLQHPGIIPIYEIGRWPDGTPFYSMRQVSGQTLGDLLRAADGLAGRLAALPALIAAADAIAYAHARRHIHRDLKPSNILVGDHGETVVIDWGLAKDLSSDAPSTGELDDRLEQLRHAAPGLTSDGSVLGTPAYMPPEQAQGRRVDERADVYALGAILYDLLTGDAPYAGVGNDVLRQVKEGAPPPIDTLVPEAPRDLISIAAKAMARDPDERYRDAGELAEELRRFDNGLRVHAHAYSPGDLFRRWMRRNRKALVSLAVAIAMLLVVGSIAIAGVIADRARAEAKLEALGRAVGCDGVPDEIRGAEVRCDGVVKGRVAPGPVP